MSAQKQNRREFLGRVAMGVAGTGIGALLLAKSAAATGEMPYRTAGERPFEQMG